MSVALEPKETLLFVKPLQQVLECPLRITNGNPGPVAFKAKTTDPKHFCSRPNQGIIQPGETTDVQITANALTEEIVSSFARKPKFLIQTLLLSPEDETKPLSDLPWLSTGSEEGSKVHQQKLKIRFADAPAPSKKRPSSPHQSRFSKPLPLISLDPSEHLEFHRPLTRRIGITLVITNVHSEPIAVKVKTNNSRRYTARPNVCRLEPGARVDISVHLLEMSEEPPLSYECKDKFMIQSAVITPERDGMALFDIFATTPPSESEWHVRDHKLGVVFLPPLARSASPYSSDTVKPASSSTAPLLLPSSDEKKSRPPSLLAKTVTRLRRASWRHSGSGSR